jgi:hypothetical protein
MVLCGDGAGAFSVLNIFLVLWFPSLGRWGIMGGFGFVPAEWVAPSGTVANFGGASGSQNWANSCNGICTKFCSSFSSVHRVLS